MCRGNQNHDTVDRHIVDTDPHPTSACGRARELISAAADGELSHGELARLTEHVAGCASCARHQEALAALARRTRVRAVGTDPAFVAAVMGRAQPARLRRGRWLRPALAWCGMLVAAQSVRPLLFGEIDGAPTHVARHVGASTLALAIGLLYVAWRPRRAAGLLPLVGALFATMLLSASFDIAAGRRSVLSEAMHLSELVGLVLVWMIAGSPGGDRFVLRRHRRVAAPSTS